MLIAAGLLLALGILLIALMTHGHGNSPAGQPTTSAPPPSSRHSTPVASSSPPSSSAPASSASSAPTSSAIQPGNGHGPSKSKGKGTPTDAELSQAIIDYYALLPGNTDQAWDRLTKRYQDGTAKNRQTYQSFWDSIESVSTSSVSGSAPDSAQATLTYTFKDGRVVTEQTAFTLVPQDGILKIDSSNVLSSRTG